MRGWTQSEGGTAERVDTVGEVLVRGWTQSGGGGVLLRGWTQSGRGTAERVDTVRGRYC